MGHTDAVVEGEDLFEANPSIARGVREGEIGEYIYIYINE